MVNCGNKQQQEPQQQQQQQPQQQQQLPEPRKAALVASPSVLHNNLSCISDCHDGSSTFAYIHGAEVHLSRGIGINRLHSQVEYKSSINVLQACFCRLGSDVVLVLATFHGVHIFNNNGTIELLKYTLPRFNTTNGSYSNDVVAIADTLVETSENCVHVISSEFCRGICSFSTSGDVAYVCVGTSNGTLLVFRDSHEVEGIEFYRERCEQTAAISDLFSDNTTLASADDNGNIVLWRTQSLKKVMSIKGAGDVCCALCLIPDFVIAAYGSGHLRVFSQASGCLLVEMLAHTRWINALSMCLLDSGREALLVSVGNDSAIYVWQITPRPEDKDSPIGVSLKSSCLVKNAFITGAQFFGKSHSLAVAVYDERFLYLF